MFTEKAYNISEVTDRKLLQKCIEKKKYFFVVFDNRNEIYLWNIIEDKYIGTVFALHF